MRNQEKKNATKELNILVNKIRLLKKYKIWKFKVLKRDYPELKEKDIRRNRLQVHHIIPIKQLILENNIKTPKEASKCANLWNVDNGKSVRKGEHYFITQIERMKYPSKGFIDYLKYLVGIIETKYQPWQPKISKRK